MRLSFVLLLLAELLVDLIRASSNNEDILFDFFSPNADSDVNSEVLTSLNGQNHSSPDPFESAINSFATINGANAVSVNSTNALNNLTNASPDSIKTNFKLKKQKLFFGKKLLLWKRNTNRGYGAFLMLCEPDITCVTPQTKLAIANCMNSGGSALANQLYNSCSNQNRIQCTDQDVARRLLGCLRLQSANNVLITAQSRACVRQVVTLGTLDCFVRILRAKPKYRLNVRYSTIAPDAAGAVTAAGMGEGNIEGVEDPDADSQNGVRRLEADSQNGNNSNNNSARKSETEIQPQNDNSVQRVENIRRLAKRESKDDQIVVKSSLQASSGSQGGLVDKPLNENRRVTVRDSAQLVTLSYDEDSFGDWNRTFLNDNDFSESGYSETISDNENDSFNESFNDVMDLKNNLTLSDGNEDDEFEEVDSEEEDDENLLTNTNNGTESRLQVSLAFNNGPPDGWTSSTKFATIGNLAQLNGPSKVSNFSNSFDLIKSINLVNSLRNNQNGNPNGHNANGPNGNYQNGNQFSKSLLSYSAKSTFNANSPAGSPTDAKQQVRSKRQCRHNRKYNGKRRWHGRDRPNRRTYPYQYNHFKDSPDDDERKWELIERKRRV